MSLFSNQTVNDQNQEWKPPDIWLSLKSQGASISLERSQNNFSENVNVLRLQNNARFTFDLKKRGNIKLQNGVVLKKREYEVWQCKSHKLVCEYSKCKAKVLYYMHDNVEYINFRRCVHASQQKKKTKKKTKKPTIVVPKKKKPKKKVNHPKWIAIENAGVRREQSFAQNKVGKVIEVLHYREFRFCFNKNVKGIIYIPNNDIVLKEQMYKLFSYKGKSFIKLYYWQQENGYYVNLDRINDDVTPQMNQNEETPRNTSTVENLNDLSPNNPSNLPFLFKNVEDEFGRSLLSETNVVNGNMDSEVTDINNIGIVGNIPPNENGKRKRKKDSKGRSIDGNVVIETKPIGRTKDSYLFDLPLLEEEGSIALRNNDNGVSSDDGREGGRKRKRDNSGKTIDVDIISETLPEGVDKDSEHKIFIHGLNPSCGRIEIPNVTLLCCETFFEHRICDMIIPGLIPVSKKKNGLKVNIDNRIAEVLRITDDDLKKYVTKYESIQNVEGNENDRKVINVCCYVPISNVAKKVNVKVEFISQSFGYYCEDTKVNGYEYVNDNKNVKKDEEKPFEIIPKDNNLPFSSFVEDFEHNLKDDGKNENIENDDDSFNEENGFSFFQMYLNCFKKYKKGNKIDFDTVPDEELIKITNKFRRNGKDLTDCMGYNIAMHLINDKTGDIKLLSRLFKLKLVSLDHKDNFGNDYYYWASFFKNKPVNDLLKEYNVDKNAEKITIRAKFANHKKKHKDQNKLLDFFVFKDRIDSASKSVGKNLIWDFLSSDTQKDLILQSGINDSSMIDFDSIILGFATKKIFNKKISGPPFLQMLEEVEAFLKKFQNRNVPFEIVAFEEFKKCYNSQHLLLLREIILKFIKTRLQNHVTLHIFDSPTGKKFQNHIQKVDPAVVIAHSEQLAGKDFITCTAYLDNFMWDVINKGKEFITLTSVEFTSSSVLGNVFKIKHWKKDKYVAESPTVKLSSIPDNVSEYLRVYNDVKEKNADKSLQNNLIAIAASAILGSTDSEHEKTMICVLLYSYEIQKGLPLKSRCIDIKKYDDLNIRKINKISELFLQILYNFYMVLSDNNIINNENIVELIDLYDFRLFYFIYTHFTNGKIKILPQDIKILDVSSIKLTAVQDKKTQDMTQQSNNKEGKIEKNIVKFDNEIIPEYFESFQKFENEDKYDEVREHVESVKKSKKYSPKTHWASDKKLEAREPDEFKMRMNTNANLIEKYSKVMKGNYKRITCVTQKWGKESKKKSKKVSKVEMMKKKNTLSKTLEKVKGIYNEIEQLRSNVEYGFTEKMVKWKKLFYRITNVYIESDCGIETLIFLVNFERFMCIRKEMKRQKDLEVNNKNLFKKLKWNCLDLFLKLLSLFSKIYERENVEENVKKEKKRKGKKGKNGKKGRKSNNKKRKGGGKFDIPELKQLNEYIRKKREEINHKEKFAKLRREMMLLKFRDEKDIIMYQIENDELFQEYEDVKEKMILNDFWNKKDYYRYKQYLGFIPDEWQKDIINYVDRDKSVIIAAPTSSGKTFIAYYAMKKVLEESDDGICVFVAPTIALVNQVSAEIRSRFQKTNDKGVALSGVFTSRTRVNPLNCQILVTVPAILHVLLLSPHKTCLEWKSRIKYIIFDEFHTINDFDQGHLWEQLIQLTGPIPILALSATIGNPKEFQNWLKKNKDGDVNLISFNERPVDLVYSYFDKSKNEIVDIHPVGLLNENGSNEKLISSVDDLKQMTPNQLFQLHTCLNYYMAKDIMKDIVIYGKNGIFEPMEVNKMEIRNYEKKLKNKIKTILKMSKSENEMRKQFNKVILQLKPKCKALKRNLDELFDEVPTVVKALISKNALPAIVFHFVRRHIPKLARKLIDYIKENDDFSLFKSEKEELSLKMEIENFKIENEFTDDMLEKNPSLQAEIEMLAYGIGLHYGGTSDLIKCEVERLFRLGKLKIIFATGTLSYGINMPCKSTVIYGDSIFLNNTLFNQVSGRGGRRGFDTIGRCLIYGVTNVRATRLMIGKNSNIIGKMGLDSSLVLRMLIYKQGFENKSEQYLRDFERLVSYPLFNLNNSFDGNVNRDLVLFHFRLYMELLCREGQVNSTCDPVDYARLTSRLFYTEPNNLVFVNLYRSGVLNQLVYEKMGYDEDRKIKFSEFKGVNREIELDFLRIFCYLFEKDAGYFERGDLVMKDIPKIIKGKIFQFHDELLELLKDFLTYKGSLLSEKETLSLPMSEIKIPYSNTNQITIPKDVLNVLQNSRNVNDNIINEFSGLSGVNIDIKGEKNISLLVDSLRRDFFVEKNSLPIPPSVLTKREKSNFIYDYYTSLNMKQSVKKYGISFQEGDERVNRFVKVLKILENGINQIDPSPRVVIVRDIDVEKLVSEVNIPKIMTKEIAKFCLMSKPHNPKSVFYRNLKGKKILKLHAEYMKNEGKRNNTNVNLVLYIIRTIISNFRSKIGKKKRTFFVGGNKKKIGKGKVKPIRVDDTRIRKGKDGFEVHALERENRILAEIEKKKRDKYAKKSNRKVKSGGRSKRNKEED